MITVDNGYVIYCVNEDTFYTGAGFNKNIRFAQIYHSLKYVRDAIKNMSRKFPYAHLEGNEYEVYPVTIGLTSSFPIDMTEEEK